MPSIFWGLVAVAAWVGGAEEARGSLYGDFAGVFRGFRREINCGDSRRVGDWATAWRRPGAGRGADGAGGDLLEATQSFVDGLGVGEGVEQVGGDEDDVGAGLHAVVVLAAHTFAEVEMPRR